MSQLQSMGVRHVVEDSSGNAAASLAAYAARAGIDIEVFCPASASPGKLAQIKLYGAQLRLIEGPRQRTTEALEQPCRSYAEISMPPTCGTRIFLKGSKPWPLRSPSKMVGRHPDVIICPVGAGSILLGLHKGFTELQRAGVIERLPRLFAAQAANICPVYQAYERHDTDVPAMAASRPTLAEGIALPCPVRGVALLQALRETQGWSCGGLGGRDSGRACHPRAPRDLCRTDISCGGKGSGAP